MSKPHIPYIVVWLITAKCNLNCRHCYAKQYLNISELSRKEKIKLASEIGELGVSWVALTGGEPLLCSDVFDIARILRDYGVEISISTNATVIDDSIAEKLSKLDIYVYVSVDGPEKVHDAIRGSGTFAKVLNSIKTLKKWSVGFGTVMAVGKKNYRHVREYLEFAYDVEAESISIIPVMPFKGLNTKEHIITSKEYLKVIKDVEEFAKINKVLVSLWCTPFAPLVVKSNYVSYYNCRTYDILDIDPYGRLLACDVTGISITNTRGKSLSEALIEYQEDPFIRNLVHPKDLNPLCANCRLADYCKGGCFARAMIEKGGPNSGDPLCPIVSGLMC